MSLAVIDTGCANLSSVAFAFERLGASTKITDDADVIRAADRVVLPGVGAAPFAIKNMKNKGLDTLVQTLQQPLLGICLGMQMLFDTLVEGGQEIDGLGLIPGKVDALDTHDLPAPHMGWNSLTVRSDTPLLRGVSTGDYAYFVHSFAAPVSDYTVASSEHGDEFTAIVKKGNVYGCQFHPERSSQTGSKILENFLGL